MHTMTRSLSLPARLDNLDRFQSFISDVARDLGASPGYINRVLLVSEEALVNIISYAYPIDAPGDITVLCQTDDLQNLRVHFEDTGKAFDMLSVPDPDTTLSIEERGIGGLGIFFIRRMTSEARYVREDGKNILMLCMAPEQTPHS